MDDCSHANIETVSEREGGGWRGFESQGVPPGQQFSKISVVKLQRCVDCGWKRVRLEAVDPMDTEVSPWIPPEA